jgi:hypothetical protein
MKVRDGYVSNSSSSSYIIGIAVIKPEFEKEAIEIAKKNVWLYDIEVGKDENIYVESFDCNYVSMFLESNKKALVFKGFGDVEENEDGEIISEPELEDFAQEIQDIFGKNYEYFDKIDYVMGAGFNG